MQTRNIQIENVQTAGPVVLAPMAGITDVPFRRAVARFGAGMMFSEMVASQEMVQANASTRKRAEGTDDLCPTGVQIAGREAHWMGECARICEDLGAPVIDINMGCPAKKVTNGASGSALMRNVAFAVTLIEAVVNAVSVPVTLKMRLGWDDDEKNAPDLAAAAVSAGVKMITVHGRTRSQFFKGTADWSAIRAVREAVDVPLIANGDVVSGESAEAALTKSGADGVMVGRGAQGRPWLVAEIAAELTGETPAEAPEGDALADLIIEHYEDMLSFYGTDIGVRVARKHLGWYLERLEGGAILKREVQTCADPKAVVALLERVRTLAPLEDAAVAA